MIDWSRICLDLRHKFGSMPSVARAMHIRKPDYLSKILRGEVEEPRYSIGNELIDLYRRQIRPDVPVVGAMQQMRLM